MRALCGALATVHAVIQGGRGRTVAELAAEVEQQLDGPRGIDAVAAGRGDCARPRAMEVAAALNRLRTLQVGQGGGRAPPGL